MRWKVKQTLLLASLLSSSLAWSFDLPVKVDKGAYKHFSLSKKDRASFANNDELKMVVRHLGKEEAKLFVTFEDANSSDYWSRLNFKTTLFPGRNVLRFDLTQKVGEKGSTGARRLDRKALKKFYIIADPDEEVSSSFSILVEQIKFLKNKKPNVPKGVYLFNFKGKKHVYSPLPGEMVIDGASSYKKGNHGFKFIDFWRSEDAKIAPKRLSTSLSVNSGEFIVSLPNGKYHYELIWDHIGYWDAPFWKLRKLIVNEKVVLIETRNDVQDYLKDYLSLMAEPQFDEDLYSFYLKKRLAPVTGELIVKDNIASFRFEGDPSGVSLNSLLIWPSNNAIADSFKKELETFYSASFTKRYRRVGAQKGKFKSMSARAISPSELMRSGGKCPQKIKAAHLGTSDFEGSITLCLELPNDSPVTYAIAGEHKDKFSLEQFLFRPKSVDLNHETYIMRAEDIAPINHPSFRPNGHRKRFLRLIKKKGIPAGEYSGEIVFKQDGQSSKLEFTFKNIEGEYDLGAYRAGFLGLSPFPTTSFSGKGVKDATIEFGKKAIKELQGHGFKLFTDYPAPEVEYLGANKSMFKLNTKGFDQLASHTTSSELLFYNGGFPKKLFSGHQRNAGQSEKSYWENMREELEQMRTAHSKKFIYFYSDEATGHRNAISEDTDLFKKYKNLFPLLQLGGFGDLREWERAKGLYKLWDYGFYSEVPNKKALQEARKNGQVLGLYNLCSGPEENLLWCFGPQLYLLKHNGINRYLEWHASGIHNYPGLDLDGRESDIALFYPSLDGRLIRTARFSKAVAGIELALKLDLLEKQISKGKNSALHTDIKKWLASIKAVKAFPIKSLKARHQAKVQQISTKADLFLQQLF